MYDRIQGVLPVAVMEGTHFRVPWLQSPAVMDIRTRPRSISSVTGTKGGFGCRSVLTQSNKYTVWASDDEFAWTTQICRW